MADITTGADITLNDGIFHTWNRWAAILCVGYRVNTGIIGYLQF